MPSPLDLLKRLIATSGRTDINALRDLFESHVRPRSATPIDHQIIANELLRNAEEPDVITHAFYAQNSPAKGAYQLAERRDGTYIPYMVAFDKGMGSLMLEDAYNNAKKLYPQDPVFLYATPESKGFYRKQPNWVESEYEGIPKFERKAKGGLIQMKECSCG